MTNSNIVKSNANHSVTALPEEVLSFIEKGMPRMATKKLKDSLPDSVGSLIRWRIEGENVVGVYYDITRSEATITDIDRSLILISQTCQASKPDFIGRLLMKCDLVCKNKAEDSFDIKMRAAIFAEELRMFPVDCIKDAFENWMRTEKWTPSLFDIRDVCGKSFAPRLALRRAVADLLEYTNKGKSEKNENKEMKDNLDALLNEFKPKVKRRPLV